MTGGPRVLLVSPEYAPTPGGLGDYTARLAQALLLAGAAPAVLTSRAPAAADNPAAPVPVWRRIERWGWRLPVHLVAAAREWRADIVHVQYQTGAYALHPAVNLSPWWPRRGRRPRFAVTFHDIRTPYLFPKAGRLRRGVNVLLANGCDLTVATNPADAAWLAPHARRLVTVPIGANVEPDATTDAVAARLRLELGLARHEGLLATFGLINHSKGLPTLLRALALLNHADSVGRYRLVLVGAADAGMDPTDRTTTARVKALAADLGVADALIWTGQLPPPTVAGWLRTADAVALPFVDGASYRRGTLLAALAAGAAVVTTTPAADHADEAVGLPPLTSGLHASLVPPEDPAALATALAATAGDAWLNGALRRGAARLAQNFTWPHIAERTLTAYRPLLASDQ